MTHKLHNLSQRSELMRALRNFFYQHSFIEVETPVMIAAPAPEENIESVTAERGFLRTSPELAMKVLLSQGAEKMFQMGPAFRHNEFGRKHGMVKITFEEGCLKIDGKIVCKKK